MPPSYTPNGWLQTIRRAFFIEPQPFKRGGKMCRHLRSLLVASDVGMICRSSTKSRAGKTGIRFRVDTRSGQTFYCRSECRTWVCRR